MAGKHRHSLAGAPSVTEDVRRRIIERGDVLTKMARYVANRYANETDPDARRELASFLDEIHDQAKALKAHTTTEFAPRYRALPATAGAGTPVRIGPLHKGTLTQYGYASNNDEAKRHRALTAAVKAHGQLHVVHKLNAVAVLNKTRNKRLSSIFRADQQWVTSKYGKH